MAAVDNVTTMEMEEIEQMIREMADDDDDSDEVEENEKPPSVKKTRGQQKVKLEKMTNPKQLGVTYAKRRGGLCKKADAIAGLTGAEVGLVVFSPTGKPFTYGSPDADTIIDRYIAGSDYGSTSQNPVARRVRKLEGELGRVMGEVETEKKRRLELRKQRKEMQMQSKMWWAAPYHRFHKNQQEWFKTSLERMHTELASLTLMPSQQSQNNQVLDNDASNITTDDNANNYAPQIDQSLMMMPAVMDDDTQTSLNPFVYQNQIQSMLDGNYAMMPAPGLPPLPDELYNWNGEYMGGFGGAATGYY